MPRSTSPTKENTDYQSDHDVLIELRTDFRNFAERMMTDVTDIKSGQAMQIGKMDARIVAIETWKQTKAADERIATWELAAERVNSNLTDRRIAKVDSAVEWIENYRGSWKWVMVAVSFVSGAFVYFIDHVLPLIKWK